MGVWNSDRQGEHAYLVQHCKNQRSNVRNCPQFIDGAPDIDATVVDIQEFLLPKNIITGVCRLCYLSFQYLLLLHKDILQYLLHLSFFVHFKQKIDAGSSVTLISHDSWTFVGWGSNKKKN